MKIIYIKSDKKKPAIFFDRDGVINRDVAGKYITDINDVNIYKTAIDGLRKIDSNKYHLIIITNQSAINRGYITIEEAVDINNYIVGLLKENAININAIYFCPHRPDENCSCRKPIPGLVYEAMKDYNIVLKESFMVGDKKTDMDMAKELGIKKIMVKTGQYRNEILKYGDIGYDFIVNNLKSLNKYV
ncbi:MAG: HAD-IIIA family hydrolase [Elusimicrobia bacterium]|nr:HAD-IIIA family hydrolase [Elusimicrobiota bacterium]